MRVVVLLVGAVLWQGCDMPTPLAPAEPIGQVPSWGASFNQPANPSGLVPGAAPDGAPSLSSAGAAMPGAVASFAGGDAAAGKTLYEAQCARCHGGQGEGGVALNAPELRSAAWQDRTTDAQLARTIALGRGAMPAFRDSLDKAGLANVIAYVRTLKKGE
jgi:mono/diheme cytochrome c family protein